MESPSLNHVALLVKDIEEFIENNASLRLEMGKIEEFPSEGTRELYIGRANKTAKLLVMQAIGKGPYQRAFEKRGVGLHHIAIDVANASEFSNGLSGSGWNLHPCSLKTYKELGQIWLCKTGNPLIEVQEKQNIGDGAAFVEEVSIPFSSPSLCEALQLPTITIGPRFQISIQGNKIECDFD